MSTLFELYVYTMGTKAYAQKMVTLLVGRSAIRTARPNLFFPSHRIAFGRAIRLLG